MFYFELSYGEVHMANNWGRLLANSQQDIGALITTTHEEMNLTNNYVEEIKGRSSLSRAFR